MPVELVASALRACYPAAVPRPLVSLLAAALTLWPASGVRADVPAPTIHWSAHGEDPCTRPADVEAKVLKLVAPPADAALQATFQVWIGPLSDGRYRIGVRLAGESGESVRVLSSCEDAREAAILLMAMALGPEASGGSQAQVAQASVPQGDSAQRLPNARRASTRWTLMLAALVDHGTLPSVSAGPALGAVFSYGLLRLGLAGRYLGTRDVANLPSGVDARFDWLAGTLHASALWRLGAWALGPRAELELGVLRGRATGVEQAEPVTTLWAAVLGGLEVEVWLHRRVGLQFGVVVGPALRRARFALAESPAFHTIAPLVARGFLGLQCRIDAKD